MANPVTRYTKGFYMYGAPLAGWDNYIEEVAKTEQDTKYARWWATSKFRDLYSGRKSKDLWPTGEPALLNTQLLLSEILLVLIGDGLKAIAPGNGTDHRNGGCVTSPQLAAGLAPCLLTSILEACSLILLLCSSLSSACGQ